MSDHSEQHMKDEDNYHDYLTQGEQQYQDTGKFSPMLKVEPEDRLKCSIQFKFSTIKHESEKAILFTFDAGNEAGTTTDEWFPKKLCSNLDLAAKTFYCWDVFAQDKKGHLIDAGCTISSDTPKELGQENTDG